VSAAASTKRVKSETLRANAAESKANDQEDKLNCTICMDNERRVMYRPCNHFIACGQCPATVNATHCPFCAAAIKESIPLYMNG
jgi:hypothetical protein